MPAAYRVPNIPDNEEGWGPTSTTVPEQLEGVPYAPYGKGDKVGRISDFTASGFNKYGGDAPSASVPLVVLDDHRESLLVIAA